jgi:hypothetical protein
MRRIWTWPMHRSGLAGLPWWETLRRTLALPLVALVLLGGVAKIITFWWQGLTGVPLNRMRNELAQENREAAEAGGK